MKFENIKSLNDYMLQWTFWNHIIKILSKVETLYADYFLNNSPPQKLGISQMCLKAERTFISVTEILTSLCISTNLL